MKCASELNIGPIKQMMQSMGITEDDIEAVSEQFGDMMENMDDFQLGGAGTMPFMQNFLNNNPIENNSSSAEEQVEEEEIEEDNKGKKKKKKQVETETVVEGN